MFRKTTLAAFAALLLSAGAARAAAPAVITYSGFLLDSAGNPVTTASSLTFKFYNTGDPPGSQTLGHETVPNVVPSPEGYFSVVLGTNYQPGALPWEDLFDLPVWMSVQFGSEAEMSPRVQLTSVPSALSVDWANVTNKPTSITGIEGGSGLAGSGNSGTVTLSVDYTRVQARVATCAVGTSIRSIDQGGLVTCEDNTPYTAGAGVVITGTMISANLAGPNGDYGTANSVARGDHVHDGRYYTQSQLNTTGTINATGNPVQWTRLTGVPSGLADGLDADSAAAKGVAGAQATLPAWSGTLQMVQVASNAVSFPAAGYAVVTASFAPSNCRTGNADPQGYGLFYVKLDGTVISNGNWEGGNQYPHQTSISHVEVASAGTHTYTLEVGAYANTASCSVYYPYITVLYVPRSL